MAVRHYNIVLTTVGLVHIGCGTKLSKKDYFARGGGVAVLDVPKFVERLSKAGDGDLKAYLAFLEYHDEKKQNDQEACLQVFLDERPHLKQAANDSVAYTVDFPLNKSRRGEWQYHDVFAFIKDAYGCPYVPGSSVKGVIRTAILTSMIMADRDGYAGLVGQRDADACIEKRALWRERPDPRDPNVVNDVMRYVSVSDSRPLSTGDLVFAKKYDLFSKGDPVNHKKDFGKNLTDRTGNALDVYRECLRPGTRVELTLDIDDRVDAHLAPTVLDADGLRAVLKASFELYEERFLSHFELGGAGAKDSGGAADDGRCRYVYQAGPFAGTRCRNASANGTGYCNKHQEHAAAAGEAVTCYLGGGVDFDSKTVVNALFSDADESLYRIADTLYEQFPTELDRSLHRELEADVREAGYEPKPMRATYRGSRLAKGKNDYRHWRDAEFGVSPHTAKLGIVGNEKHPMGTCSIAIEERR